MAMAFAGPAAGRIRERMDQPGRFVLDSLVTLPKGAQVVRMSSSVEHVAALGGEEPMQAGGASVFRVESTGEPTLLSLTLRTGGPRDKPPSARVTTRPGDGPGAESDLPGSAYLLPWAPPSPPPPAPLESVPHLAGGDPVKGRAVFLSAESKCSACHRVKGEGATVGPDLSALAGRDRVEVYRDVYEPSARIHPDYVSYTVALKDGRVVVGTIRAEGASAIRVTDTEAKSTTIPRSEIEDLRPSATSIMPVGLAGAIGAERLRDLIAFLTAPPR
jgi:putative heme-binding domain-containing protein